MYVLTSALIHYGSRSIRMERNPNTEIPAAINGTDDLDLDTIADDLNKFVHNRGGSYRLRDRRRGNTPAARWQLEVSELAPEAAAELEAAMKADGIKLKGPITPSISVIGNGIALRYEKI